jgi:hypothetical protein
MSGRWEAVFAERVLRWALLLYPKAYREQHGSEIAGIYSAATGDAHRGEVLREALNVTGHGLRTRLGLTSDRFGGEVLATALPFILGSVAGLSGYMLYLLLGADTNAHHEWFRGPHSLSGGGVLAYAPMPVLAAATGLVLAALAGRWSWARGFAVATVGAGAVTMLAVFELRRGRHIFVLTTFPGFELPLMLAAFALMVLAVPVDAGIQPRRRGTTVVVGLIVAGLLHLAWVREGFAWSLITAMPGVVAVVLAVALAAGLRNPLLPGAVALTCIPWLIQPLTGDLYDYGFSGTQYVLLVALAIVVVLAAGRSRRRTLDRQRA